MANYKVTIEKLNEEAKGKNEAYECDELLVIGMTPDDGGVNTNTMLAATIEHLSTALHDQDALVAACRLAVARHDVVEDMKRAEIREMFSSGEMAAKMMGAAII